MRTQSSLIASLVANLVGILLVSACNDAPVYIVGDATLDATPNDTGTSDTAVGTDATFDDTGPDPDTVSEDDADVDANVDTECTPGGTYFCAISLSVDRNAPIYLSAEFSLDGSTLTIDAQALVRDLDEDGTTPMPDARQLAGEPFPQFRTTLGSDGTFTTGRSEVTLVGDANPLTYRDISVDFELSGQFVSEGIAFGAVAGEVTNPTFLPLAGSTFACQRSDDPNSVDPVYFDDRITELAETDGCGASDAP